MDVDYSMSGLSGINLTKNKEIDELKNTEQGWEINAKPEVAESERANSFPRCESGKRGDPQRTAFQGQTGRTFEAGIVSKHKEPNAE